MFGGADDEDRVGHQQQHQIETQIGEHGIRRRVMAFTLDRYFGSQPSTDAWYSVRDDPAIEVMSDNTKARTSMTTTTGRSIGRHEPSGP